MRLVKIRRAPFLHKASWQGRPTELADVRLGSDSSSVCGRGLVQPDWLKADGHCGSVHKLAGLRQGSTALGGRQHRECVNPMQSIGRFMPGVIESKERTASFLAGFNSCQEAECFPMICVVLTAGRAVHRAGIFASNSKSQN